MNRLAIPLAIGVASLLFLAVAACFQAGEEDAPFTEPCIPLDGSTIDPCDRDPLWSLETGIAMSIADDAVPELPIDLFTEIKDSAEYGDSAGLTAPQFFVRGVFVPGSARCAEAAVITMAATRQQMEFAPRPVRSGIASDEEWVHFNCFVDMRVTEYFNGDGPGTIPIIVYWGDAYREPTPLHQAFLRGWPGTQLEGKEMVVALIRPLDISVAAWGYKYTLGWDVQRRADGEVVVVSLWAGLLGVSDTSEWEYTLEEFRPMVKEAMGRFRADTGGRVGYHADDPEFAEDANGASLIENLRDLGAFTVDDVTPVPAPTVPGETDPDPYGFSVNDDTVTASPEIPGGLEDTPTPVSALGDEPTATATAPTPESEASDE